MPGTAASIANRARPLTRSWASAAGTRRPTEPARVRVGAAGSATLIPAPAGGPPRPSRRRGSSRSCRSGRGCRPGSARPRRRSGRGCSSSSAFVARMKPGVQYEHWNAVWSTYACWIGWSSPSGPSRPSTVATLVPSAASASMRQPETGWPSTRTVQAPHMPTPQPSRAPSSASSLRSTSSSVSVEETSSACASPLTVSSISLAASIRPARTARPRGRGSRAEPSRG